MEKTLTKPYSNDPGDADLRELLLVLWRQKYVLTTITLCGLICAAAILSFIKPQYTAKALLLIEGNARSAEENLQTFQDIKKYDSALVLGEAEVLRSRSLARKVVDKLGLINDPAFNTKMNVSQKHGADDTSFKALSVSGTEIKTLPDKVLSKDIDRIVGKFIKGINIRPIPGSFAIMVEYNALSPHMAALVANTLASTYIEQQLESQYDATKKLSGWLDKRLTELRTQVEHAEQQAEQYRARHNLTEGTRALLSAEQLSKMNEQILEARTAQAEARTKLDLVMGLEKNFDLVETAPEEISTDFIRTLKLDAIRIERELSELSNRYGSKHPEIIKRRNELSDLRETITAEIRKTVTAMQDKLSLETARADALEETFRSLTSRRNTDNEAMITLRALEREAESSKLILNTFLETYKRSNKQEELEEPKVRLISHATPPATPTFPNKSLIMALSGVMSFFVALGLALLIERLDNTFKSAKQLEAATGYACHALIPLYKKAPRTEVASYVLAKPASNIAEAVRTLRTSVNLDALKTNGNAPRVLTITSSLPGEGKTTLSVWLARLAARAGENVIVVDCDLRRPALHKSLGKKNAASLIDVLTGEKTLESVIDKSEREGLHVIYADTAPESALDLMTSRTMQNLIEDLKARYDLVILDSPASLAVSDARVLAALSDQTLYAVRWHKTPVQVVMSGTKQFRDMNYQNLALVLTGVDVKKHAQYGYGDMGYYYAKDKTYYNN